MKKITIATLITFLLIFFAGCGDSGYTVDGIDDSVSPVSMREDTTDSWKVVTIAQSNLSPEDYAYSYYKTCFEDGDTIHWIVNFNTNTTTSISKSGDSVFVTVYEYVDGEEHSAKSIGTGTVYGEWSMNPDTGEMTKVK